MGIVLGMCLPTNVMISVHVPTEGSWFLLSGCRPDSLTRAALPFQAAHCIMSGVTVPVFGCWMQILSCSHMTNCCLATRHHSLCSICFLSQSYLALLWSRAAAKPNFLFHFGWSMPQLFWSMLQVIAADAFTNTISLVYIHVYFTIFIYLCCHFCMKLFRGIWIVNILSSKRLISHTLCVYFWQFYNTLYLDVRI